MATLLRMPEVAANATHATLTAWTCKEGDVVAQGDCLAEIETDKAVVELAADAAGVIGRLFVKAGQEIAVSAPIGVLLAVGETSAEAEALLAAAGMTNAPGAEPGPHPPSGPAYETRVFASPLARRLASDAGLAIARLVGSGPNGRIVKRDVELAVSRAAAAAPLPAATDAPAVSAPAGGASNYTERPHTGMRRTIARRLAESKSSIPHFYLSADCRVDRLLALRKDLNTEAGRKISVNDFIVRAVAMALREVPGANVGWTDTAMRHHAHADVAVAVATDAGLITPIVRHADTKSLSAISAEIADLASRARAGRLRPDEYQGGSFSVSNLGMFGVDEFTAIINPPQAAILAVGATKEQAVVEAGQLGVGSVMRVTLSVDHRAIDGALAAQWLMAFRRLIEAPLAMLL